MYDVHADPHQNQWMSCTTYSSAAHRLTSISAITITQNNGNMVRKSERGNQTIVVSREGMDLPDGGCLGQDPDRNCPP